MLNWLQQILYFGAKKWFMICIGLALINLIYNQLSNSACMDLVITLHLMDRSTEIRAALVNLFELNHQGARYTHTNIYIHIDNNSLSIDCSVCVRPAQSDVGT